MRRHRFQAPYGEGRWLNAAAICRRGSYVWPYCGSSWQDARHIHLNSCGARLCTMKVSLYLIALTLFAVAGGTVLRTLYQAGVVDVGEAFSGAAVTIAFLALAVSFRSSINSSAASREANMLTQRDHDFRVYSLKADLRERLERATAVPLFEEKPPNPFELFHIHSRAKGLFTDTTVKTLEQLAGSAVDFAGAEENAQGSFNDKITLHEAGIRLEAARKCCLKLASEAAKAIDKEITLPPSPPVISAL